MGRGGPILHGQHGTMGADLSNHIDPVCWKDVPPSEGYGKMHAGQLPRFCPRQCLDAFDAVPERYKSNPRKVKP